MNAPRGAIWGGRCLSSLSFGEMNLGESFRTNCQVCSAFRGSVAELSAEDVCEPVEDLRTGVRRLALPQGLLASHCTPNSRFVPSFPVEGQKSSGSTCLLPAAPVFRARH